MGVSTAIARAPSACARAVKHQVVKVNDLEPIAGFSSISQEHTEILQALTVKKPTIPAQFDPFVVERLQRSTIGINDLQV